jgi:hypothetical protein
MKTGFINRIIAVMKLSRRWSERATETGAIINACLLCTLVTFPGTLLADAQTQLGKFSDAQKDTLKRTIGAVANRNAEWELLYNYMIKILNVVQDAADADLTNAEKIITQCLFKIKKSAIKSKNVFHAKNGSTSGTILLVGDTANGVTTHYWSMSTDGITYTALPDTTKATTLVTELSAGSNVWFKHRYLSRKGGYSDWSNPVSIIVL